MRSLSQDIRDRVIAAREGGQSAADTAQRLSISKRSVERIWKRYSETGKREGLQRGGYRVPVLKDHEVRLRQWIHEKPGITLEQLCRLCQEHLGITLTQVGLWRHLRRIGLRFKKNAARKRTEPQ